MDINYKFRMLEIFKTRGWKTGKDKSYYAISPDEVLKVYIKNVKENKYYFRGILELRESTNNNNYFKQVIDRVGVDIEQEILIFDNTVNNIIDEIEERYCLPRTKRVLNNGNTLDEELEKIAFHILHMETLETRNSDELDFYDVAVWNIKRAFDEVYHLGKTMKRKSINLDKEYELIARKKLGVETLKTRKLDELDFYDISVWCMKDALLAVYQLKFR